MLTVVIVIVGLSLLILAHEAGHFFAAKYFKLKIDEFGFGFPPRAFAWKRGETEYSVNWLLFGGFVKIRGERDHLDVRDGTIASAEVARGNYAYQKAWRRAIIIAAGVLVNFFLGWFLLVAVYAVGAPPVVVISGVEAGSPAETVGLKSGDIVVGHTNVDDFISFITENRGTKVTVTVLRGAKKMFFEVVPRSEVGENQGALGVVLQNGGIEAQPIHKAVWFGFVHSLRIVAMTVQGLGSLVKGIVTTGGISSDVVGPVGIFSLAHQVGAIGVIYLIQLVSLISLNLAVINLIPFPALDGGRLLLIAVEKLKGSPISRRTEIAVNTLGFVLLILLMVVITVRDIVRLI